MNEIRLSYDLWNYLKQFRTCSDIDLAKYKIKYNVGNAEYLLKRKYYFKLISLTDRMYFESVKGDSKLITNYQRLKGNFVSLVTLYNNSDIKFY